MQYALVHNNRIEVGPRTWNYYFFLEYLKENNLSLEQLPRSTPTEAVITNNWKVLPVSHVVFPENLNSIYEELVGPFWTIHENYITGLYNRKDKEISTIQAELKNAIASNRYIVETGKLEYTFRDGETVEIYTEREERMIYLNTLSILSDGETVPFKFKRGKFRTSVTKIELAEIVNLGMTHIRNAFEWEATKVRKIDSLSTVEDLKTIEVRHPTQIINEEKINAYQ